MFFARRYFRMEFINAFFLFLSLAVGSCVVAYVTATGHPHALIIWYFTLMLAAASDFIVQNIVRQRRELEAVIRKMMLMRLKEEQEERESAARAKEFGEESEF